MASPRLTATAKFLSVAGHPLLTGSVFTVYIAYRQLPFFNAVLVTTLLIGGVVLPVSWQNYRRVKQGRYTNFDVSHQKQRHQFYYTLMSLLALMTGLLFLTGQPWPFCYGALAMLLLTVSSFLVNLFVKASLHTSVSLFITWALLLVSGPAAVGMAFFSLLIAVSRLILNRHTLTEIVAGALIGLLIGAGLYMTIIQHHP